MIIKEKVGLVSFGAYLPRYAIKTSEIELAWAKQIDEVARSIKIYQKSVPDIDEDSITMAVEASLMAIERMEMQKNQIEAVFMGSESHPYAVKPSGTVLSQALGLKNNLAMADLEFACKAGTQALQIGLSYCLSKMAQQVLALGADTAQAEPGDALEYSASAGAAAFVVGSKNLLTEILATTSYASDTPDFWRRPKEDYPRHAGRFTGKPAYFHHVYHAAQQLLQEIKIEPSKIDYCIFHTPNAKFPRVIAKKLGFCEAQLKPSLIVEQVGNTYSAASLLALIAVLDQAKAKETIFLTSYGSGSGADAFLFKTTDLLVKKRKSFKNLLQSQIQQFSYLNYQQYLKHNSHDN